MHCPSLSVLFILRARLPPLPSLLPPPALLLHSVWLVSLPAYQTPHSTPLPVAAATLFDGYRFRCFLHRLALQLGGALPMFFRCTWLFRCCSAIVGL
jgi:hypothetical protein